MRGFFELLTDKRFSLKFRLLNILSGDYLRNYLAVGVYGYILDCDKALADKQNIDAATLKIIKRNIAKAKRGMDDVWDI